jgi:hypothetical protein
MSEDSIQVIMIKLEHMESLISQIHTEVKRTNGRVTELEMLEAKWQGKEEAKRPYGIVATTIVAYGLLAVIAWFVGHNV